MVVTSIAHSRRHGTPYMGLNKCEHCRGFTLTHMRTMVLVYKNLQNLAILGKGKCWCAYSSTMVRIWETKHFQFFANGCYISGWWYTYPSEKYEFVSWGKMIPNIWKVIKFMFQNNNQYIYIYIHLFMGF